MRCAVPLYLESGCQTPAWPTLAMENFRPDNELCKIHQNQICLSFPRWWIQQCGPANYWYPG